MVDDRLFEVALEVVAVLLEVEKFQHQRVLDHVGWNGDLLAALAQRQHLLLVLAGADPLEQHGANLPLQLAGGPVLADRLDLVEATGSFVVDGDQQPVMSPGEVGGNDGLEKARHCGAFLDLLDNML